MTLYATDLDGTLLRSDMTISDDCARKLNMLMSDGVLFTYATARSFNTAAPLLKKVYIPKYIFPLEKCCFAMVNCIFSFVALLLVMIFTGSPFHLTILEALYPLVTLFFFSLGVSMFLAAATVFFRDIMHMWQVFTTALLPSRKKHFG